MTASAYTTEPACTLEELNGCLQSLMSMTKGNDFTFTATRLQLQAVCRSLKNSVSCVDEHMKLCFNPTQRKVFNHVVSGARQVLAELCVPGPIQEEDVDSRTVQQAILDKLEDQQIQGYKLWIWCAILRS
ncbi:uncharacterized protein NPIL_427791 [Nephila pilipes]|uniref:Uncharacterized protein n=1 Tax=Nephila pilipes TaxID=299642 RepID=A0A8X6PB72_NEPPI|nr:uncharacterized protein NPIL_427791 [Nephila pilipes]